MINQLKPSQANHVASDGDAPTPPEPVVDLDRIARAVADILDAVGEDVSRDGLRDTPARVARMYAEIFSGVHEDPTVYLERTFEAGHREMVLVRDIPFYSMCEHHLAPFFGQAHIGYVPGDDGRIVGLSKLARLTDGYSRRPQVQERLTEQLADAIHTALRPSGVIVMLRAEHLCMSMRGTRKPGATTVTSAVRGQFLTDAAARAEAVSIITGSL